VLIAAERCESASQNWRVILPMTRASRAILVSNARVWLGLCPVAKT